MSWLDETVAKDAHDVRMPELTGLDILPGIRKLQPEASIIVITAFGSEEVRPLPF